MDTSFAALPCVVYGARGHGRVVADALLTNNIVLIAFVDDDVHVRGTRVFDIEVHDFDWLTQQRDRHLVVALGIGDNHARQSAAERCSKLGLVVRPVVHRSAIVSQRAELGAGSVVLAGAVVNAVASVGTGALVNTGAIVEHDVEIGPYAHISPNAVLAGGSRLGELSHLGAGAVVIDDVFVGARTVVGAGAVVTRHVPDDVVSYGVPARVRRQRVRS
jgi:sugar O-acyltransferase (sialic acid O-acetyltransferase NeuD family)